MNVSKACEILGVDINYTPELLKKRYRALAMEHHPDKGGTAEQFSEINAAHEFLSREKGVAFEKIDDIFGNIFKSFVFNKFSKPHPQQERIIKITPKEYLTGSKQSIATKYQCSCNPKTCDKCLGCGILMTGVCLNCVGQGYVQNCLQCQHGTLTKNVCIDIPPKQSCVLHPSIGIIKIKVDKPYFLKQDKLYCNFHVTLKESLTGFCKKFKDPFGIEQEVLVQGIIKSNDGYQLKNVILVFIVDYPEKINPIVIEQLKSMDF
jgi:hypothetical protein